MKTVLLVQEFGMNLGHVTRLARIAQSLRPHRCIFAVPNPDLAQPVVARMLGTAVEVVGGPQFDPPASAMSRSTGDRTLADVFHNLGYAHHETLLAACLRWRALLDRVRPDLIVSDFAPTVRLASWDRIPVVAVTNGYGLPPAAMRLPPIGPLGPVNQTSRIREDELLETARTVRASLGGPPVSHFSDLFQGERGFVVVTPGCDPYAKWRQTRSYHPMAGGHIRCGPPVTERTGPDVFCYFWSDHPVIDVLITALNRLNRPSQVHIRGVDPQRLIAQCAPQVGIRLQPADFAVLLPQTRLFVHYGASGAAYAGMLAGTTQLILPALLEHEVNAFAMVAKGVARAASVAADASPQALQNLIEATAGNKALHRKARDNAAKILAARTAEALPDIIAACREFLDRPLET